MSISTPAGDQSRPSAVSTGKKPPAGGKPAAKAAKPAAKAAKAGGGKPSGGSSGGASGGARKPAGGAAKAGGGKGPRKPITPVRVSQGRSWGPIALFVAAAFKGSQPWEDQASGIDGIVNYRENSDKTLTASGHKWGPLTYKLSPPVGGDHNYNWQNCMGDVYDAPIATEHAVHSMEHGAVWVAYKSGLAGDQVETLASKVRGNDFMLMSPIDNLDANISLQAWGYQLKVDSADDGRVDDFIKALRQNATIEPGAACSGGITATGTTPRDLGKDGQTGG